MVFMKLETFCHSFFCSVSLCFWDCSCMYVRLLVTVSQVTKALPVFSDHFLFANSFCCYIFKSLIISSGLSNHLLSPCSKFFSFEKLYFTALVILFGSFFITSIFLFVMITCSFKSLNIFIIVILKCLPILLCLSFLGLFLLTYIFVLGYIFFVSWLVY